MLQIGQADSFRLPDHHCYVVIAASPSLCRRCYAAISMPPSLFRHRHAAIALPSLLCRHLHAAIAFSSSPCRHRFAVVAISDVCVVLQRGLAFLRAEPDPALRGLRFTWRISSRPFPASVPGAPPCSPEDVPACFCPWPGSHTQTCRVPRPSL